MSYSSQESNGGHRKLNTLYISVFFFFRYKAKLNFLNENNTFSKWMLFIEFFFLFQKMWYLIWAWMPTEWCRKIFLDFNVSKKKCDLKFATGVKILVLLIIQNKYQIGINSVSCVFFLYQLTFFVNYSVMQFISRINRYKTNLKIIQRKLNNIICTWQICYNAFVKLIESLRNRRVEKKLLL